MIDRSAAFLKSKSTQMSSSIISSVESITRNNENDFALDAKRKQSIDSMREMGEYANENIPPFIVW